jgi:hypothetical protein
MLGALYAGEQLIGHRALCGSIVEPVVVFGTPAVKLTVTPHFAGLHARLTKGH